METSKNLKSKEINTANIQISLIDNFPNNPFRVQDDEDMGLLAESIKERGLITPVIVRPLESGRYELISGHRRKRAFEILGLSAISAEIRELSDLEATALMVESNFQRQSILPSEMARALKMRMDAIGRQGQRTDLTSTPAVSRLDDQISTSAEKIGKRLGISREQVRRYIRLTYLVPELLEYVDAGKIAFRPAVELSYLTEEHQRDIVDYIDDTDITPSHAQAIHLHKLEKEGFLNSNLLVRIMSELKPNQRDKFIFKAEILNELIPNGYTDRQREEYVVQALQFYNKSNKKENCR